MTTQAPGVRPGGRTARPDAHAEGTGRPGRLPAAAREARREQILRAAMDEIAEHGYERATMARIAARAGASKETLYAWFRDKEGLAAALIEANADHAVPVPAPDAIDESHTVADAQAALTSCAEGLLVLLTSRDSIALNRAAMTSPVLAETLRSSGRDRTGPAIEGYLSRLHELGVLDAPDPPEAFRLLYGLVVQDAQIQTLLGAAPPRASDRQARASRAVAGFLTLVATARSR